jgi:hypothetical protein
MSKLDVKVDEAAVTRWKAKYNCTAGDNGGWCDGVKARRCPMCLCHKKDLGDSGCYLAI